MTDILNARRNGSDICWILKDYESKISYFNDYKSKEIIKKTVLNSTQFKYDIKLLSDKNGKSDMELSNEAESILSNMSHNIGMNSIRFMGVTLSKIMKSLYTHVRVNDDGVEKLRRVFAESNVVLLPTHRSYADFLLVSYVMFHYNLPMPVIAAAMDFMNMKLVGELLRSCGAFFIRRSFVDDDLYWCVFSHYIKTLIRISQESLEFFIEGTRSRTNKSLFPKIGMLGIILETWLSSNCDIKIVPIGISYDRLLEEKLYAWELFGVPKPKESTSGLLKVRHILKENFGTVYFNIGDPISISELAHQFGVKRLHHNLELRFKPTLFESEKCFLKQFSKIIVESQQKNYILSDWTIIIFILMNHGTDRCRPLHIDLLLQHFSRMVKLLTLFGAKLALSCVYDVMNMSNDVILARIKESLNVHKNLVEVDGQGVILVGCTSDINLPLESPQLDLMIVDRIHYGIYRNPILFHVIRESLLLNRIKYGIDGIFEDFKCVFDLFSREFVYSGTIKSNFDSAAEKLRAAYILIHGWTINQEHDCLTDIENASTLHIVAYIVYAHVFRTSVVPNILTMTVTDQVKALQLVAVRLCSTDEFLASRYLEICSLDIARNALVQMTDVHKRQSLDSVNDILNILYNFVTMETRLHLQMVLNNITCGL